MFPFAAYLNAAGWAHLALFGLYVPGLVLLNRRKVISPDRPLPNRLRHFQSTTLSLVIFAAVSLVVARVQHIGLFPPVLPSLAAIGAGALLYGAAVAYMLPRWRRAVRRGVRSVHLFMPSTGVERAWWMVVAVLAGVSEEITWRGVQMALLIALSGNYWLAAAIAAVSFGVAHMVQGWRSSAHIVVFAMGFHVVVWLSGSLYVAMAVHNAYDITAGLVYGRLGRTLGYRPSGSGAEPDRGQVV